MRDSLFYLIAILFMIIVIIDGKVYWYEAFSLLILYVLYIIAMSQNSRIESWSYSHITFMGKIIYKLKKLLNNFFKITLKFI
jgi:Ca2+/Na+ antiporter